MIFETYMEDAGASWKSMDGFILFKNFLQDLVLQK